MFDLDLSTPVHAHFIGIGGISMSGLAVILKDKGFKVSGSDRAAGEVTNRLEAQGIRVYIGNDPKNLEDRPDVVIATAAIHPDNPEYARAKELNIPILTRAELLGSIMGGYETSIGVAGTHGKTTTTSMLTYILMEAEKDPTVSVGGMLGLIGGNIRVGGEKVFLTEACEYTNSFLSFKPTMEVILNVEADHLDFFKDIDDIRNSFNRFARLLPEDGTLAISSAIRDPGEILKGVTCKTVLTFGEKGCSDIYYENETLRKDGCYDFTVRAKGCAIDGMKVSLNVPGVHNILNSLGAIAIASALEISPDVISASLSHFFGTERRFQLKGTYKGAKVIDDYAHHPQEITATLSAAKNMGRIVLIFQPHTYSRTKALFNDFASSLSAADEVILAPIYAARETDTLGMDSKLLADAVSALGTNAAGFDSFSEIKEHIKKIARPGDLIITMGAGDVYKIGEDLINDTDKD